MSQVGDTVWCMNNDYARALELLRQVDAELFPVLTRCYTGCGGGEILPDPAPHYPPTASELFNGEFNRVLWQSVPYVDVYQITEPRRFDWWKFSFIAIFGGAFAGLLIGAVAVILVMAIFQLGDALWGSLGFMVLIGGALGYFLSLLFLNGSRDARLADARESAVMITDQRRERVSARLYVAMLERWALYVAYWLQIPERLHPQFVREFVERQNFPASQWDLRIRGYQLAPEYPPPPGSTTKRVTHEHFEEYCARHLRSIGFVSAKTTRFSKDGGIDIICDELVVQCKHLQGSGSVSVSVVREIFGIASHHSKLAVVITSGSYTKAAEREAQIFGVALFRLDELKGILEAKNNASRQLLKRSSQT